MKVQTLVGGSNYSQVYVYQCGTWDHTNELTGAAAKEAEVKK